MWSGFMAPFSCKNIELLAKKTQTYRWCINNYFWHLMQYFSFKLAWSIRWAYLLSTMSKISHLACKQFFKSISNFTDCLDWNQNNFSNINVTIKIFYVCWMHFYSYISFCFLNTFSYLRFHVSQHAFSPLKRKHEYYNN